MNFSNLNNDEISPWVLGVTIAMKCLFLLYFWVIIIKLIYNYKIKAKYYIIKFKKNFNKVIWYLNYYLRILLKFSWSYCDMRSCYNVSYF